jgi:hypothetical protein
MEQKAALLRDEFPGKTTQNVLVYHGSIAGSVSKSPYIYRALSSDVLFS